MELSKIDRLQLRPLITLALLSLIVCGIAFPLFITGIAQVSLPYQANGDIVYFNGQPVGSELIAQNFTLPIFFHPRNDSASEVDPHISLEDAYAQVTRIHDATGILENEINQIINQNKEGTYWIFGDPYVNVLKLNLILIETYPTVYNEYQ